MSHYEQAVEKVKKIAEESITNTLSGFKMLPRVGVPSSPRQKQYLKTCLRFGFIAKAQQYILSKIKRGWV